MRPRPSIFAIALAATLLAGGCSHSAGGDALAEGTPGVTARWSIDGQWHDLAGGGLADAAPIPYTDATLETPTRVRLTFVAKDPGCTAYAARLQETTEQITITLNEGRPAAQEPSTCDDSTQNAEMYIDLSEAAGRRPIVDGAKDGPGT